MASPRCLAAATGDFQAFFDLRGWPVSSEKSGQPEGHFKRGIGLGQARGNRSFRHRIARLSETPRIRQGKIPAEYPASHTPDGPN